MQPVSQVGTPRQPGSGDATHSSTTHRSTARSRWRFVGNYLALVVAMLVGMGVGDVAARAALTATGLQFPAQYLELVALKMAFDGAVGMLVWTLLRGHGRATALELAGAMLAAPVVLFPLLWLGVISGEVLILLEHVVVLPLIYLVMRRHRSQYGG
jgi:hypothetical protein